MLNPDGKISMTVTSDSFSGGTVSTNTWYKVLCTISLKSSTHYFATIGIDDKTYLPVKSVLTTPITFAMSDKVLLGGPTGVLANIHKIRLYSPGSHILNPGKIIFFSFSINNSRSLY